MEKNWNEFDQNGYEYVEYILNKKIFYNNRILLYSEPVYEHVTETVKKTFGGTKEVTRKYIKSIRLVNLDLTENTISNGCLDFLTYMITYYNVEKLRKNYLNIEKQFKMFQAYEDKQIEKEFIIAKTL